MIDWLDFTIAFKHKTIEQGAFMIVEHDSSLIRSTAISRRVEGSYLSSYGVSSICKIFDDVNVLSLPSNSVSKLFKSSDLPAFGNSTHIKFSGNPAKFLQGHNVFGSENLIDLVVGVVKATLPLLDFSQFEISKVIRLVKAGKFKVTRIDITRSFDLGSDKAVEDYLYMLPLLARVRGNRIEAINQTVYFGKHSTIYTIKIYNKFLELNSKSKKHSLPDELSNSGILEYSEGKLRVELCLRKKQLDKLNLTNPNLLQANLDNLFIEHIGRIEMNNQKINTKKIFNLPKHLQTTFFVWEVGKNCKKELSKPTFYRHRRELMKHGIDISKPPVPDDLRVATVAPLLRHLVPKACETIPQSLEKYAFRNVA